MPGGKLAPLPTPCSTHEDTKSDKEETDSKENITYVESAAKSQNIQGKQIDFDEEDAVSEEDDAESIEESTEPGNPTVKTSK